MVFLSRALDSVDAEGGGSEGRLLHSSLHGFIRLLCNLANHNELAALRLGQTPGFLNLTLTLLTQLCPTKLPQAKVSAPCLR